MIVVADTSPLIFLTAIRQLHLIHTLFGKDVILPEAVREEALAPGINTLDKETIEAFLATCRIETVRHPRHFATAMSRADNEALTLALLRRADLLLCDERVMRTMAEAEGIRPLGTLGILLKAMQAKHTTPPETRQMIENLIRFHGFRIGIELYRAVLAQLDAVNF